LEEVSYRRTRVLYCRFVRFSICYKNAFRLWGRAVEVYANDGEAAIFTTNGAGPESIGVEAFATGGSARLVSLRSWPLRPASFHMDRFR